MIGAYGGKDGEEAIEVDAELLAVVERTVGTCCATALEFELVTTDEILGFVIVE